MQGLLCRFVNSFVHNEQDTKAIGLSSPLDNVCEITAPKPYWEASAAILRGKFES